MTTLAQERIFCVWEKQKLDPQQKGTYMYVLILSWGSKLTIRNLKDIHDSGYSIIC